MRPGDELKLLNNLTVTRLSNLTNLSKSYICQVKQGKFPPSPKLLEALRNYNKPRPQQVDYYGLFIQSREAMHLSPGTLTFYQNKLRRFFNQVNPDIAKQKDIEWQGP